MATVSVGGWQGPGAYYPLMATLYPVDYTVSYSLVPHNMQIYRVLKSFGC